MKAIEDKISGGYFSFYSPQLDGLRFIAALLVFIHHGPDLNYLGFIKKFGWVGVDLFLCISAFLLTRLLTLEFNKTGYIGIKNFFIRRALRIWPLYFFFVTVVCMLAYLRYMLDAKVCFSWWLSHLTFTNNFLTAIKGYSPIPYSAHLWTISLEEQAYLLLPVLLLILLRSKVSIIEMKRWTVILLVVLMMTRLVFILSAIPHPFIWVLPFRADSFLLGALAAMITVNREVSYPRVTIFLGITVMFGAAALQSFEVDSLYQIFGYTLVAVGCVLVLVASQANGMQNSLMACNSFRYLGKISYGIYVFHVICLALVAKFLSTMGVYHDTLHALLGLLLTVSLSAISYRLLEKPFLKLKSRFSVIESRPI